MAVQDKRSIVVIARQDKVRSVPKGQVKLDTYRQRPYCAVVDQLEPLWFLANSALPTLGIPCRIVEGALRKVWLLVPVLVRWIESRFRFRVRSRQGETRQGKRSIVVIARQEVDLCNRKTRGRSS